MRIRMGIHADPDPQHCLSTTTSNCLTIMNALPIADILYFRGAEEFQYFELDHYCVPNCQQMYEVVKKYLKGSQSMDYLRLTLM